MAAAALETARQSEQSRIDGSRTASERNASGQFATAMPLALEIARLVNTLRRWPDEPIRLLEPALGTGAFYSAARQTFARHLMERSVGIERDERFAAAARRIWSETDLEVRQADFTATAPPQPAEAFNVILTNPPYVRHHHLDRDQKLRLKRVTFAGCAIGMSGLAGLYAYFLLIAHQWMSDGGIAAWLLPTEFMDVNYGAALREYLASHVTLLRIHQFDPADAQFDDAVVTSAVVVFEKTQASADHTVLFSAGGSLSRPRSVQSIAVAELRLMPKWLAIAQGANTRANPKTTEPTLGNFFSIKRGIATGANAFFIMERRQAIDRGVPEPFLRPILPGSRRLRQDTIDGMADGYPAIDRPLAVIDCPISESEVEHRYPAFWSYLQAGKTQGIHEGYLASRRSPWYAQEMRAPAPFLCTYMGRKGTRGKPFRFFWNRSRAIAPNVFLMLYPRDDLRRALESRPELLAVIFERLQRITPETLMSHGRVYGGGLHKVEPRELAQVPAWNWELITQR